MTVDPTSALFRDKVVVPMNFKCLANRFFFIALFVTSCAVVAGPVCDVPQENWLKEAEVKDQLKRQGYFVKSVRIESGCYEIYGLDPRGRRVLLLVDPATAKVVPNH